MDPRPLPKITKNRPRRSKNGFWGAFGTRLFLKVGLGRVWGGFWEGLGMVLGGFWKDFGEVLGGCWGEKL